MKSLNRKKDKLDAKNVELIQLAILKKNYQKSIIFYDNIGIQTLI